MRQAALRLLDRGSSTEELRHSCSELYQWFTDATGLGEGASDSVGLATGLALAPDAAARCLLDTARTVAFVRGLSLALGEARRRYPVGVLEVVYAGTGPFAPLVLPLMTACAFPDVRFTFLDIDRRAAETVEGLIAELGLRQRVGAVLQCDATCYRHPCSIHVVVTETMQRSLGREPFVAIVRNLRRQLAPGGILVPERVVVELAVVDAADEQARWNGAARPGRRAGLARLFEVTAAGEVPAPDADGHSGPVVVTIPDGESGVERWVALLTRIDVFADIRLGDYDSGLTVPEILWPLSPARGGETIRFHYVLDATPGIRWARL